MNDNELECSCGYIGSVIDSEITCCPICGKRYVVTDFGFVEISNDLFLSKFYRSYCD